MFRLRNEEEFNKVISWLEKEKRFDEYNEKQLKEIDLTHLPTNKRTGKLTGKATAMITVFSKYGKASNALIKKYKETFKQKKIWERYNSTAKERKWIII